MLRLENWYVYNGALVGRVFGHPEHLNNAEVIVPIKFLNLDSGYATSKRGKVYKLGESKINEDSTCAHFDIKEF